MKQVSLLLMSFLMMGASCGPGGKGPWTTTRVIEYQEEAYTLEALKVITPFIVENDNPSTVNQFKHHMQDNYRVLMKFESLNTHLDEIDMFDKQTLEVRINALTDVFAEVSRHELKLCPLTKSWMMAATWMYAAPVAGGTWLKPGGDYDENDCILPIKYSEPETVVIVDRPKVPVETNPNKKPGDDDTDDTDTPPTPPPTEHYLPPGPKDPKILRYNVTNWFVNTAKGRNMNYGFVLKCNQDVEIYGDQSSHNAPQIVWLTRDMRWRHDPKKPKEEKKKPIEETPKDKPKPKPGPTPKYW